MNLKKTLGKSVTVFLTLSLLTSCFNTRYPFELKRENNFEHDFPPVVREPVLLRLDLDQMIDIAEAVNLDLQAKRLEFEIEKESISHERWKMLPSLNAA